MATRFATRRYADPIAFWRDYQGTMKAGALFLPAGTIEDEPAAEMKVDLVVPGHARVGPIEAQLINRMPDGAVALRIAEAPANLGEVATAVGALVEAARAWLLDSKQLVLPTRLDPAELDALRARVAELEARLAEAEARRSDAERARGDLARALAAGQGAARVAEVAASAVPAARGFPVPDVSGLPALYAGEMGSRALRDAFMHLAVDKATGLLSITYPDGRRRWGFWSKGGCVGWRSEPIEEQEVLGILLFRANQLDREQLAASIELMERKNIRQGEALIELGLITFAQLVLLLGKQVEFILQRVLADKEGSFEFHSLEELPERFLPPPARVAAVLFRQLKNSAKDLAAEDLAGALRPNLDLYVYIRPGVERTLDEMRLSNDEQGFIRILTKTSYRLREMSAVSNLSRSQTAVMIWCLLQLGLVEFRAEEAARRVTDRIARDLESRKAVVRKGTLFDRLELHWICTGPEVEAAWKRLQAEYGLDQAARFGDEWKGTMELIGAGMKEAYERLRTDAGRREYRLSIIEKPMIDQSAQMLGVKGEMALVKENWREAQDCYAKALELIPNNAEYSSGLAKAKR